MKANAENLNVIAKAFTDSHLILTVDDVMPLLNGYTGNVKICAINKPVECGSRKRIYDIRTEVSALRTEDLDALMRGRIFSIRMYKTNEVRLYVIVGKIDRTELDKATQYMRTRVHATADGMHTAREILSIISFLLNIN